MTTIRLTLIVLLVRYVDGSPTMCHCASGQVGMTCPQPLQMSCPTMQCPPHPPCNPFPTLAPLPTVAMQGIAQFTLPTLAPLQGGAFGPQAATPLPVPMQQPGSRQESLQSFQNHQYNTAQQQHYHQPTAVLTPSHPPPPPPVALAIGQIAQPQVNIQASNQLNEPIFVDLTTVATTLPSESYAEADAPENPSIGDLDDKFALYENQPNKECIRKTNLENIKLFIFDGYRLPSRRALASSATKPEVFTSKCNDDRLKKLIEDNIDADPSSSKRKIQKAATNQIGGLFDVICSSHDFSYLANTQLFCEAGNEYITCFAFLHSLMQ